MSWRDTLLNDPAGAAMIDNQDYSVNFIVCPTQWHLAEILPLLSWNSVKFEPGQKQHVPTDPGLYAFVVRIPYLGLPAHGWVMYIGQTGDGNSHKTLRQRFGEYLHNKKTGKRRPKIFYLLNAWDGHLEFFYAPLPDRKSELVNLETNLLGAFRPPFTDRTYPATYMSPSHAF